MSTHPPTTEIYTLSLHDALPIYARDPKTQAILPLRGKILNVERASMDKVVANTEIQSLIAAIGGGIGADFDLARTRYGKDRKSTRLNSSHMSISYAVFCLKKKRI